MVGTHVIIVEVAIWFLNDTGRDLFPCLFVYRIELSYFLIILFLREAEKKSVDIMLLK